MKRSMMAAGSIALITATLLMFRSAIPAILSFFVTRYGVAIVLMIAFVLLQLYARGLVRGTSERALVVMSSWFCVFLAATTALWSVYEAIGGQASSIGMLLTTAVCMFSGNSQIKDRIES